MGTLTLTELKAELKAGLGNRSDLDSRLTRFLNLAQQRLARVNDFDEMQTISTSAFPYANTSADKYITLPSLRELYAFKAIDGLQSWKLDQWTPRRFNNEIPAPQALARDKPRVYTIWNNTCIIWPLANQADISSEIWWTRWPTALTDASPNATSEFLQKDEVLIELGLVYAFNSLGKVEQAQAHWTRARGLLMESTLTDAERPDLDIRPGLSTVQAFEAGMPGEYWNDPFVRSSR